MFRISLEGVAGDARGDVQARVADAVHLIEDATSDRRIWLLEPGAPQPGQPAHLGAIVRAIWIAADGDELLCRPRDRDELILLIRDLELAARCAAMRTLDNPAPPPAVGGVSIIVLDAQHTALPIGAALEDGAVCDFVVRNDGDAPVWVALLELGADRTVGALYPEGAGPGEQINPGESLAFGADYLGRLPDFAEEISIGLPADFPWVMQPDPLAEPPSCVFTLKAIVSTGPIVLALDGPMDALANSLDSSPHAWGCVHREQTINAPPLEPEQVPEPEEGKRQISPTGSGYVLVYWAEKLDGTELGRLGVTANKGMTPTMDNARGYWLFPQAGKAWPSEFRLRPGKQGKATVDIAGVHVSQVGNGFYGAQRRTNPSFGTVFKSISLTSVDQSWEVSSLGKRVGYMARVGERLHWFTQDKRLSYLPRKILQFKSAPLPLGGGDFYSAVDLPLA